MADFASLPCEAVLLIFDEIDDERDIASLCRTSRGLHRLASRQLYRRHTRRHDCWALCWAADRGKTDVAKKLLAEGAYVSVPACAWGFMAPLAVAAGNGHAEFTMLLLEAGGLDPEGGQQALALAAGQPQAELLELLLSFRYSETPLDYKEHAVERAARGVTPSRMDNTAVLRLLLRHPSINVNHGDVQRITPLHRAAICGNAAHVRLLLDAGADVNARDIAGNTPLNVCVVGRSEEVLAMLLAIPGVHVNAANNEGRTVLMNAVNLFYLYEWALVSRLMSDERVRPNIMDGDGHTVLTIAASNGDSKCVSQLLSRDDIEVNVVDMLGESALHHAIRSESNATVKLLVDDGRIDTRAEDDEGRTPLLVAVDCGESEMARLLFESGRCDLEDRRDEDEAWWLARVENKDNKMIEVLREFGNRMRIDYVLS